MTKITRTFTTVTLKAADGYSSFTFEYSGDASQLIKALSTSAHYVDYAYDKDDNRYEYVERKPIRIEFSTTDAINQADHDDLQAEKVELKAAS